MITPIKKIPELELLDWQKSGPPDVSVGSFS
jgi:hypothetical protein